MPTVDGVELALAFYRAPLLHQERFAANAPPPTEMDLLLGMAKGSAAALRSAACRTGARTGELQQAARFLIQQFCFARGASHYRVLGLDPDAPFAKIKDRHRRLMSLYHPDRAAGGESWEDSYAARINEAWSVLSRTEARAVYDDRLQRMEIAAPKFVPAKLAGGYPRVLPEGARQPSRYRRSRLPAGRRALFLWSLLGLILMAILAAAAIRSVLPLGGLRVYASLDRTTSSPIPVAVDAAVAPPRKMAYSGTPSDPPPVADGVTSAEILDLLEHYAAAYRAGDLDELMALFATGVRGNGRQDREAIRRDYGKLFQSYPDRRLHFHDLRWDLQDAKARVVARYDLWLRGRITGQVSQSTGTIRLDLERRENRILISSIDRHWPAF